MTEVVQCVYKERCTDYPNKCKRCAYNLGRKSFFKPMVP
jgi:hypothetical protein